MISVLEKQYMETVIRMGRRLQSGEHDWEQRRYEIAKEVFARRLCLPEEQLALTIEADAETAVEMADALIEALKRQHCNG